MYQCNMFFVASISLFVVIVIQQTIVASQFNQSQQTTGEKYEFTKRKVNRTRQSENFLKGDRFVGLLLD